MSDPLGLFTNQGTQDPLGLFGSGEEDQPSKIPGVARQVPRPADPSALDYLRGGIESTAAITSAAAMSIPALLATPFFGEKGFNRVMKEAYQPRGEVGQDWTDKAGHVAENLNALGASGIGEFVGIPARLSSAARLRGAKDVAPNNIRAKLKEIKEEPKLAAIEKARQEDIASRNPKNRQANDLAALGDESGQMALFDQGDQMGKRNQFNAGDLGDWRIDENGIPVRVDKSLEALNVEQPLQRNLWGDELGPALDQGRSLTQSIDDTPKDGNWAQRRGMTNRLGGDGRVLEPGNDLLTAKMEADGPKLPFEEQTKFEPTNPMETRRLGDDPLGLFGDMEKVNPIEGIKPKAEGNRAGATIEMTDGTMPKSADAQWLLDQTTPSTGVDKLITATVDGNVVGHLELAINPDGTASVRNVTVDPAYQRQGIATELYNRAKEAGYTIERSPYQTEAGAAFREVYDTNNSLRNAEILPPEERIPKPDTPATPRTPETIQERADNRALVESFPVKDGLLSEWTPIATKEEALSMAADTKDLTKSFKQRSLAPGMNFMAAMSRNPILRYASTILRDARVAMEFDSRRFISNNDALSPQWSKLSSDERVRSMEALQAASDEKMHLTPEHMDKLGLNEKEQAFVTKVREAMDYTLDLANEKRATLGLKPIEKLPGYLPSVFKGAYKSFVLHDGKVVGIISTDTKWGLKLSEKFYSELAGKFTDETALGREKAVAYYNKEYPGVNFQEAPRKGLSGNGRQSDLFSGTNDILSILAQNDPRFADIQNAIAESIKKSNNSLYNFNNHELAKKGITGNEGNKPWLKPLENTEAGFKSMIGFLEDAFNYHHLQVPLYELKTMNTAPEVAHLPRTMKYLDDYVKNVTGQGVNSVGRAINSILDYAPALVGVGPNVPLGIAGAIKNQASRIFMGYGNYMFTAAQMMQPFQTATPLMTLLGGRLGNTGYIPKAMFNGNTYAMLLSLEKLTGKTFDMIPEHLREGWQYAQDRGMSNFSEMERAYEGTKTKLGRAHDKLAEINMQLGES